MRSHKAFFAFERDLHDVHNLRHVGTDHHDLGRVPLSSSHATIRGNEIGPLARCADAHPLHMVSRLMARLRRYPCELTGGCFVSLLHS